MKILTVICFYIALCAGSAIPKDNSHYAEGESRYIWMSADDGMQHLVDLKEAVQQDGTRGGSSNRYLLFTRSNPNNFQILIDGNANSVFNSNYNPNVPTKVFAHGWGGSGNGGSARRVINSLLENGDYNVISLDWNTVADAGYVSAAAGVPEVGQFAGNFLLWLINTAGGDWSTVHLIGFSLGAHVVGNIGRTAHSLPNRITGLDPAGPLWWNSANALMSTDGRYVEGIHTDGRVTGIMRPVGHADFYPNGGRNPQPGCILNNCSHDRAVLLFMSSVYTDHFIGRLCSDLDEAENNSCAGHLQHNMGNSDIHKDGHGLYGLVTGREWPF